jgi:hypothetical protein
VDATVVDGAFVVRLSPDVTSTFEPGAVRWVAMASDGTDRVVIDRGVITFASLDGRTYAERMLALWQARAEEQAGDLLEEYTAVGGARQVKRYALAEVRRQLAHWTRRVQAERNGGSLPGLVFGFGSGDAGWRR